MKILHIEDEVEIARIIKKMLLPDFSVVHTSDPHDGIEMALTGNFDVIICDVSLGSYLTGFDVVKEIKSQGIHTPIISNSSDYGANQMMKRLGAKDVLSKIKSEADVTDEIREMWIQTIKGTI